MGVRTLLSWCWLSLAACATAPYVEYPLQVREGVAGPEMVHVPGGFDGVIQIDAFELDRTEVSVRAYMECFEAGACSDPRFPPRPGVRLIPEHSPCHADDPRREHHPVNCVDADEAMAYCAWRGKRLPSDLEWKWAAQGREWRRPYPWGSELPSCDRAISSDYVRYPRGQRSDSINIGAVRAGCSTGAMWPVGSKPRGASRDGALDLVGNANEWTTSCVMESGFALVGGDYVEERRSSLLTASVHMTAHRSNGGPTHGFRCARDA